MIYWLSKVRVALALSVLASSMTALTPTRVDAAPRCEFLGATGDYIDAQKTKAEAASESGNHQAAADILGKAAQYAYDCVPKELQDYIAGKPQALDVPYTRSSLYGESYFLYKDAHKEARLGKMATCEYAVGVIASMQAAGSTKQEIAKERKALGGC